MTGRLALLILADGRHTAMVRCARPGCSVVVVFEARPAERELMAARVRGALVALGWESRDVDLLCPEHCESPAVLPTGCPVCGAAPAMVLQLGFPDSPGGREVRSYVCGHPDEVVTG